MARATSRKRAKKEKLMYMGPNVPSKGLSFGSVFSSVPKGLESEVEELFAPLSEVDQRQKDSFFKKKCVAVKNKYRGE